MWLMPTSSLWLDLRSGSELSDARPSAGMLAWHAAKDNEGGSDWVNLRFCPPLVVVRTVPGGTAEVCNGRNTP